MKDFDWKKYIQSFDKRRDIIIPGNTEETIQFCVQHFIQVAQSSIRERDCFTVALSGGQTPNAIIKRLSQPPYVEQVDWSKVFCFWGDERSVPPNHSESNYYMAMQSGLASLPIPKEHIFRMEAEDNIEENARRYEQLILQYIPSGQFDLMMLGMGEDGHTASLFPRTHGLHTKGRLVVANYVPQKNTWRMTVTYECIHLARLICIYIMGKNKADMVAKVLTRPYEPDLYPIQRVGTSTNKALWVLDRDAAEKLVQIMYAQNEP